MSGCICSENYAGEVPEPFREDPGRRIIHPIRLLPTQIYKWSDKKPKWLNDLAAWPWRSYSSSRSDAINVYCPWLKILKWCCSLGSICNFSPLAFLRRLWSCDAFVWQISPMMHLAALLLPIQLLIRLHCLAVIPCCMSPSRILHYEWSWGRIFSAWVGWGFSHLGWTSRKVEFPYSCSFEDQSLKLNMKGTFFLESLQLHLSLRINLRAELFLLRLLSSIAWNDFRWGTKAPSRDGYFFCWSMAWAIFANWHFVLPHTSKCHLSNNPEIQCICCISRLRTSPKKKIASPVWCFDQGRSGCNYPMTDQCNDKPDQTHARINSGLKEYQYSSAILLCRVSHVPSMPCSLFRNAVLMEWSSDQDGSGGSGDLHQRLEWMRCPHSTWRCLMEPNKWWISKSMDWISLSAQSDYRIGAQALLWVRAREP